MFLTIPYFELKYFYVFGYPIQSWEIFFWAGWVVLATILFKEAKRLKLDIPTVWIMLLLSFLLSEFLAKLFFVLSHILLHHDFHKYGIIKIGSLGRVYFGGLLGVLAAGWLSVKITRQSKRILNYLDALLTGHVGGMIFYRFGNLLWHDHPGKVTDFPLGIVFNGQVRHEIALYEIISNSLLFLFVWLIRKKASKPGSITIFIIFWIALSRFFVDFLRSSDLPTSNFHFSFGFSLNQVAYLVITGFLMPTVVHRVKLLTGKSTAAKKAGNSEKD